MASERPKSEKVSLRSNKYNAGNLGDMFIGKLCGSNRSFVSNTSLNPASVCNTK